MLKKILNKTLPQMKFICFKGNKATFKDTVPFTLKFQLFFIFFLLNSKGWKAE